ncbi:MAG TPA: endonuclease/exonuclease/phosphatase family protein [Edaphocola sp.]|nr:endonuclease/exonuclease/phosphatase family protein [Edaphocola sp.]
MKRNTTLIRLNLLFRGAGVLFNILAIVWIFLCLFAAFNDVSDEPSIVSLFSFSNFFAVLANVFFVFFWLLTRKKKLSIWSFIALLIAYPVVKSSFAINLFTAKQITKEEQSLKVISWNVHLFDLGEWTNNKQTKSKIIDFIEVQQPDILCLQEYYFDTKNPNEPFLEMLRTLGYSYFEFAEEGQYWKRFLNISAGPKDLITVGTAILSKFPLSKPEVLDVSSGNEFYKLLGVNLDLGEDKEVRLYTTHLQSVNFVGNEVEEAEDRAKKVSAKVDDVAKGILKKIIVSSSKRAEQANFIDSVMAKNILPTLFCGDFNDMPGSYVYRKIKGTMEDAFIKKGFGWGRTYRNIFPTIRIDYIFYDSDFFKCEAASAPNLSLSDHNPVIATFSLKNSAKHN